jgi:DNA-binding transcriptional regulator of glucitol operon
VARFLTPWWLVRHVLMVVLVAAFLALGWWQIGRARDGNTLSFGYAFEWPLFAGFVVFVWVKEIRGELHRDQAPPVPPAVEVPAELSAQPGYVPFHAAARADRGGDAGDPELAAYNRYLEWLAANPDRRAGDNDRSDG